MKHIIAPTTTTGFKNDKQVTGQSGADSTKFGIHTYNVGGVVYNEIVEVVNSLTSFRGLTIGAITDTNLAQWQISRTLVSGGTTQTEYSNSGAFDQIWDDRVSLFPAPVLSNPASWLLDGVSKHISFGDNYTFGPAIAFSWSLWVKAQSVSAQRAFFSKTSQDANVFGYSLQHNSSGKIFLQVRASGTLRSFTGSTILSAATWYHIALTYAGGSNMNGFKIYINGVPESTPSSQSLNAWTVTDPLQIGRRGTGFNFSGNVNQGTVWSKELTSSEVTELYNAGSPNDPNTTSMSASLLSYWPLNDSSSFPTELDNKASVNGTYTNMSASDLVVGDVP